jgi:hypothetical protein
MTPRANVAIGRHARQSVARRDERFANDGDGSPFTTTFVAYPLSTAIDVLTIVGTGAAHGASSEAR